MREHKIRTPGLQDIAAEEQMNLPVIDTPSWSGTATTVAEVSTLGISPAFLPRAVTLEELDNAPTQEEVVQRGSRIGSIMARMRIGSKHVDELTPEPAPKRPRNILGFGEKANTAAQEYVQTMFPDKHLSLLSAEGSSSKLFEDGEGKVYKLIHSPDMYTYIENEVAASTVLHQLGLGPKPHGLIDADAKYKMNALNYGTYFPEVQFKHINGEGVLPVLVTDKVNIGNILDEMSEDAIVADMEEIVDIALEHDLYFGDVEFIYDRDKNKIQIVDAAGLGKVRTPTLGIIGQNEAGERYSVSLKDLKKARIINSTLMHLGGSGPLSEDLAEHMKHVPMATLIREQLARARKTLEDNKRRGY